MFLRSLSPILLGALLLSLAAEAAAPPAVYFPLAEGNIWKYYWKAPGDGLPPPPPYYCQMEVAGTQNIGGVETYLLNDDLDNRSLALALQPDGVYCYKADDVVLPTPQYLLKFPFTVGSSWTFNEPGQSTSFTVLSVGGGTKVEAGTFSDCVRLKSQSYGAGEYTITWLAPLVGVVKREYYGSYGLAGWYDLAVYRVTITDRTPPSKPTVTATYNGTTIHAVWSSQDKESEIVQYQAAVSTTSKESGMVQGAKWQSFGTATQGDLAQMPLLSGTSYYVIVRAMNAAGLTSEIGASKSFKIEKAVGQVGIEPAAQVAAGGNFQFKATVYDQDGLKMTGRKISWSCNAQAGRVTSSGRFTAGCAVGSYAKCVTATVAGTQISASADVEIVPGDSYKVVVEPAASSVACAETKQFKAAVCDRCKNLIPDAEVTWPPVRNTRAGGIDETGLFTAGPNPGRYSGVIVAACGAKKGTSSVTVTAPPPTKVSVSPDMAWVTVGMSRKFTATGYDALNRQIAGLKFVWTPSDAALGKISSSGLFTAFKSPGKLFVSAQALVGGAAAGAIGLAQVEVEPGPPAKALVIEPDVALAVGQQYPFQAQALDRFNNRLDGLPVSWSVTNAKVGTITADGLFTAGNAPGSYGYCVQAKVGGKIGKAKVKVAPQ